MVCVKIGYQLSVFTAYRLSGIDQYGIQKNI